MSEQNPEVQTSQAGPSEQSDYSALEQRVAALEASSTTKQSEPVTESPKSYDTLQLVGRHVPDEGSGPFRNMAEATAAGHDTISPVTGVYQIGVLVDGAFVSLFEESAGRFHNLVEVAKAAQQADEQPSE